MVVHNLTLKYVIVGDSGVGKSCLVDQFANKKFQEAHLTTIGVNLAEVVRSIQIHESDIKIQIFDTAGMEVYRSLTTAYYRNTAVTILVYDITRKSTFDNLTKWLKDIREASNNSHMIIFIVGNKIDLEKDRQVLRAEGQRFASQNKVFFLETSAKILETVEKVFFLSARVYYEKIDMGDIDIYNHASLHGVKLDTDTLDSDFLNENRRGSRCSC